MPERGTRRRLEEPSWVDQTLHSTVDAIGDTPLVALERTVDESEGRLLAKLENLNPGGSKKDRIARQIIEDARREGILAPFQTVVELSSGNTGTGLAIVCGVTRHPLVVVMSRGNSPERAAMMRALGAEVVLVDQAPGGEPGRVSGEDIHRLEEVTEKMVRDRGAFRADQFRSVSNFRAHRLHTGPEILRQTRGEFDAFCDFVGSGGTFGGCAAAFKEFDPRIRCYVVEPEGAAFLAGAELTQDRHRIQGGGYCRDLDLIDPDKIDGFVQVSEDEARLATRDLARREGIFAGYSSGANVAAARKLLEGPCRGATIVVIICDTGLKYLSTELWREDFDPS